MRGAAARARDSDATRQLKLDERAMVHDRDPRQRDRMQGWRASRDGGSYAAMKRPTTTMPPVRGTMPRARRTRSAPARPCPQ